MNNHKIYNIIEYGIEYKVLEYHSDDLKDYKYVNNFIKKYDNCKIIEKEYTYSILDVSDYYFFHNYYIPLDKILYYNFGKETCSVVEDIKDKMQKIKMQQLIESRKNKLQKINETFTINSFA